MVLEDNEATAAYGGDPLERGPRPKIVSVKLGPDGDTAVATMTLGSGPFPVRMVREGDSWKLADFWGAQGPIPKELQ